MNSFLGVCVQIFTIYIHSNTVDLLCIEFLAVFWHRTEAARPAFHTISHQHSTSHSLLCTL